MENWIDQGAAPSLAATLAAIDQGSVHAVNIYMGGRFAYLGGPNGPNGGNGWTPAFVQQIAAARPQVAFFGTWVSLSPGQGGYNLGFADGLDAALAALSYLMVRWLSYDVEPGAFDANPAGAADAMRGFTDAVHSKGFLSMPYSVPRGLAAGSQNADGIWIANPNPGGDDPANQPLDPAFFAGKRSVQCCLLIANGVDWDLSHSQFSVGDDMTPEEHAALFRIRDTTEQLWADLEQNIVNTTGGSSGAALANLLKSVAAISTPTVDVNALATALATHPLTATLSDAEREAVAQHVAAHFVVKP